MDYKKLDPKSVKGMEDAELEKTLSENDLAVQEKEEALKTANGKIESLEKDIKDLKDAKKPEEEKSARELAKELF